MINSTIHALAQHWILVSLLGSFVVLAPPRVTGSSLTGAVIDAVGSIILRTYVWMNRYIPMEKKDKLELIQRLVESGMVSAESAQDMLRDVRRDYGTADEKARIEIERLLRLDD